MFIKAVSCLNCEMEETDVVRYFQEIPSSASRRAALQGIVKQLTPYEWRELYEELGRRSFQYDIVGNLPPEIVLGIFNYLPIWSPFALQRV